MRHPLIALAALTGCAGLAAILWLAGLSPWLDVFRQLWVVWVWVGTLCLVLVWPNRLAWAKWVQPVFLAAIIAPGVPETLARMNRADVETLRPGEDVTVLTHNMWIANIAPHRTLARLSEINPDIMALQEANANSALTGQALADQYAYAARCRSNRLLSRFEILDSGCLKAPEPADWATAIPCEWEIPPGVWARVRLPNGREAVFISTHLTWPVPGDTQACQRNGLAGALEEWSDEPVVLMGDFNAAAPSRSLARMDAAFGLERRTIGLATYPAYSRFEAAGWRPAPADPMLIGIDHVYASDHWASVHVTTGPDTGSDHRPVIATLRLLDTD